MSSQERDAFLDRPWKDSTADPFIRIEGVTKRFGAFTAVEAVSLDIYKGELFSLLGGSGCGKTTLLRMLAGFEEPTAGHIYIDGVDMIDVPAYARPVNMMFQSYALFPHMSVEDNVAYGLKRDGVSKAEINQRVADMLSMVELLELQKRKPHQLSGGQRQRVALARALVKQPKLLLLDEPLAALDKRLREQTQFELMNIQDQLGVTFIVVTHDQEEAMTLSTRIAVMDHGQIIQVGEPSEVYERPQTKDIANFIGTINMFNGEVMSSSDAFLLRCPKISIPLKLPSQTELNIGQQVTLAIRPEKIKMTLEDPHDPSQITLRGEVLEFAYMGNISIYRVKIEEGVVLQITIPNLDRTAERKIEWDDQVFISWHPENSLVLRD